MLFTERVPDGRISTKESALYSHFGDVCGILFFLGLITTGALTYQETQYKPTAVEAIQEAKHNVYYSMGATAADAGVLLCLTSARNKNQIAETELFDQEADEPENE